MSKHHEDEPIDELERSDEEDEQEEVDESLVAEAEVEPEEGSAAPAKKEANTEDDAEVRTVSSREHLRKQLEEEMKRFLSNGGKIEQVSDDVVSDPPQKPKNEYGSRPI
jgi:hypothetical protein